MVKDTKILKKSLSVLMAAMMILAMTMIPAFAYTTPGLSMLTLNSSDFTIVKKADSADFTIEVFGLDSSYNWLDLTQEDKDAIEWSIDSGNSVAFKVGGTPSTTATGSPVTITMTGNVGRTTVRAHLDGLTGWDNGDVTANIVVERTTSKVYAVDDITVNVYLKDAPAGYTVPQWLQDGITYEGDVYINDFNNYLNTPDILKMDPSAMTTVGTLKYFWYIDSYTTTDSEGGYLATINGFGTDPSYTYGWQYRVKDASGNTVPESVTGGASIVPLHDGYTVEWFWGSY